MIKRACSFVTESDETLVVEDCQDYDGYLSIVLNDQEIICLSKGDAEKLKQCLEQLLK